MRLATEVVGLTGEPQGEIALGVEDEIEVLVKVDHRRRAGHGDIAYRRLTGRVEMLVVGVERDAEQRAGLPLERDAAPSVVPHRGRAAALEDEHHLLEQLAVRGELAAGRDLADVAVVGRAGSLVIDEYAAAAAPRPRLQLDGFQVRHEVGGDDVEAFVAHPALVSGLLLGRELGDQIGAGDGLSRGCAVELGVLGHRRAPSLLHAVTSLSRIPTNVNRSEPATRRLGQGKRTKVRAATSIPGRHA